MEVVGQACNGVEAVELSQLLHPDVVLMDLHMPLKGGVVATREITRALPDTQVLVLTTLDDDETVFEAVRAGAHAYLLKDAAENELLETIRALKRGESRLTPQIARKVMDQFRRLAQTGKSELAARRSRICAVRSEPAKCECDACGGSTDRKGGKGPRVDRRRHEQPADWRRFISCRGNRQKLRQSHHGEAACQYPHRARDTLAKAAARRIKSVFVALGRLFSSVTSAPGTTPI